MRYRITRATAAAAALLCMGGVSHAAGQCRGSKIYTSCSDNLSFLIASCGFNTPENSFYQACVGNANLSAVYSCQNYRVPCSYGGTFSENLELSRYPKVGPPTAPRSGTAPADIKGSLLYELFNPRH